MRCARMGANNRNALARLSSTYELACQSSCAGQYHPQRRTKTRLSRYTVRLHTFLQKFWPILARNKLTSDGSESVCFGATAASQPPFPFRRSERRPGRIPAEPCPPFEWLQCTASHSGPKALNPRGSGTESPTSAVLRSLLTVRSS